VFCFSRYRIYAVEGSGFFFEFQKGPFSFRPLSKGIRVVFFPDSFLPFLNLVAGAVLMHCRSFKLPCEG